MTLLKRACALAVAALAPAAAGAQGMSTDYEPLPAEMMPLASQSLMLDLEDTGERLIGVGERGHIVASLDGEQWAQIKVPTRATLTAVDFADSQRGWAVGHDATILHTSDGGQTWALQNFQPGLEKPFLDVLFLDQQRGIAVGAYALMYVTNDGGRTWEDFATPIRDDEWHFNAITRLNDGSLFIAGEAGTLAISQDDGETWEALDTPYDSSLFGAAPYGPAGVAIFGLRGNAFVSTDPVSGDWQTIQTGTENSLIGGAQLPSGQVVMAGINGIILKTMGGGTRVERVENPVGKTLAAVLPVKNALLVAGEAGAQLIQR